jgi:hypothetical protein
VINYDVGREGEAFVCSLGKFLKATENLLKITEEGCF